MFSGKTTELMRRMRRYSAAGKCCLLIKYAEDTRYGVSDKCYTHDRQTFDAISAVHLLRISDDFTNVDVIGIDEGQFYPDIVMFCSMMVLEGKIIIVAALDGTFQRQPFGSVLQLIPDADSVVKLNAICMKCHIRDAPFSERIQDRTSTDIIDIGGKEKYMAVCRRCYTLK